MANVWPASLPQAPLLGTLQTTPEDFRSLFQPDVGPPIIRRNAFVAGESLSFSISATDAQYTTLIDFWEDTLNHGSEEFTWTHPITDVTETFQFTKRPRITSRAGNAHRAQINLYSLDIPALLLEDGFFLLMEDGSRILLE